MVPNYSRCLLVLQVIWIVSFCSAQLNSTDISSTELPKTVGLNTSTLENQNLTESINGSESRLFAIGTPEQLVAPYNLVSPFDHSSFSSSLLPLISANIKEKVKEFARTINSGANLLEHAVHEEWRNSPLNPTNIKTLIDHRLPYFPGGPSLHQFYTKYPVQTTTTYVRKPPMIKFKDYMYDKYGKVLVKNKQNKAQVYDTVMKDLGMTGYDHFEKTVMRDIELREEQKVEATMHTMYENAEIIKGKPYGHDFGKPAGWNNVKPKPTSYNYHTNEINSQIVSPLHTSFIGNHHAHYHNIGEAVPYETHIPKQPTSYSVYEEANESKTNGVRSKLSTKSPPLSTTGYKQATRPAHPTREWKQAKKTSSRYNERKPQSHQLPKEHKESVHLDNVSIPDVKYNEPKDAVVSKPKRFTPRHHIQSLTTSRPKTGLVSNESRKVPVIAPSPVSTTSTVAPHVPIPTRGGFVPIPSIRVARTTSTTVKPVRAVKSIKVTKPTKRLAAAASAYNVQTLKPLRSNSADAGLFVDRPKTTGYRGKVKFDLMKSQLSPGYE